MSHPAELMRQTAQWTVALGGLAALGSAVMWGYPFALGVVLGAALGFANLWLLFRALGRLVASARDGQAAPSSAWAPPLALLLKWPLLLLAIGLAMWFTPARGEGIALGALLSLVAVSIAAVRQRSASTPTSED